MSAYIVFIREKTLDQTELETYWQKAPAAMEDQPIKPLAAYGRHVTLEGPDVEGVVIAEFPSLWKRPAPGTTAQRIRRPLSIGFGAPCTAG